MNHAMRSALYGLAVGPLLAACGGGGGTVPASPAPHAAMPSGTAANGAPVGTAQLTLRLPKVLVAKVPAASVARGANYVNPVGPSAGVYNVIDIYVNGTLQQNLDGVAGSSDSILVNNPNGDGTQSISFPLYSSGSNDIIAIEWDHAHANILAIGETPPGSVSFSPGSVFNVSLTMLMNVRSTIITTDNVNGSDAQIISFQNYNVGTYSCSVSPVTSNQFYLYSADATGAFVPVAGYGGITVPTVIGNFGSGTSKVVQSPDGGYFASYDSAGDQIEVETSATNPAYDVVHNQANYPGIWNYPNGLYFTIGLNPIAQTQNTDVLIKIVEIRPSVSGC